MMLKKLVFVSLIAFLLTSCGYHFTSSNYRTISVPYAVGDHDGEFTSALVYALTTGGYPYRKGGGELSLFVDLVEFRDENIGYRYDREKDGELTRTLIPAETRLTATACVRLVDCSTGCTFVPPFTVTATVEYDHDYYTTRDGVNVFSLGQLTDYDAAKVAAHRPLNRKLAQRIIDQLNQVF